MRESNLEHREEFNKPLKPTDKINVSEDLVNMLKKEMGITTVRAKYVLYKILSFEC